MLKEGLLMEEPYDYKGRPFGRPAQQFDFLPQARLEIGIELDNNMMRGCMCDLRGGILKRWDSEAIPEAYDELLARLVEKIKEFSAQIPTKQLIGIGIALPDCYAGSQTDQNGYEWNTAMLTEDISAQIGMPVWSGNRVRMRAFGRAIFGRSASLITFAYLYVSNHIVCPIGNNHRFMAAGRVTTGKSVITSFRMTIRHILRQKTRIFGKQLSVKMPCANVRRS